MSSSSEAKDLPPNPTTNTLHRPPRPPHPGIPDSDRGPRGARLPPPTRYTTTTRRWPNPLVGVPLVGTRRGRRATRLPHQPSTPYPHPAFSQTVFPDEDRGPRGARLPPPTRYTTTTRRWPNPLVGVPLVCTRRGRRATRLPHQPSTPYPHPAFSQTVFPDSDRGPRGARLPPPTRYTTTTRRWPNPLVGVPLVCTRRGRRATRLPHQPSTPYPHPAFSQTVFPDSDRGPRGARLPPPTRYTTTTRRWPNPLVGVPLVCTRRGRRATRLPHQPSTPYPHPAFSQTVFPDSDRGPRGARLPPPTRYTTTTRRWPNPLVGVPLVCTRRGRRATRLPHQPSTPYPHPAFSQTVFPDEDRGPRGARLPPPTCHASTPRHVDQPSHVGVPLVGTRRGRRAARPPPPTCRPLPTSGIPPNRLPRLRSGTQGSAATPTNPLHNHTPATTAYSPL